MRGREGRERKRERGRERETEGERRREEREREGERERRESETEREVEGLNFCMKTTVPFKKKKQAAPKSTKWLPVTESTKNLFFHFFLCK